MACPVTKAEPAEVVATGAALHVVAALILLYHGATLGTRLAVGLDPPEVLVI